MHPRILIVGTVPYNKKSTSRAFESYFSNWEKENLAQIFSNTKKPVKGHCGTLFQITDQRLVKRRLNKNVQTGVVFSYDELEEEWLTDDLETNSSFFSELYRMGSRKTSMVYLLRRLVWKKKLWNTPELNKWLDDFAPECVFLSFSDDFFIPQIALYVADKYNIPIVSSIGDDYYFNKRFSLSPFYHFYKSSYRRLIRRVFAHKGSAIYIGDKIRDKYNSEFGLNGETVYLTSDIERAEFRPVRTVSPKIVYCGNIRLGRNESLLQIAKALSEIDRGYKLTVFSNESDPAFYKKLQACENVDYRGSVPYSVVQKEISDSDITVVAEGFKEKDVNISRYSLSTKAADSLASGRFVLGYGSLECGAIEYLKNIGCGLTCTSYEELKKQLPRVFNDVEYQKKCYDSAAKITALNHRLESSNCIFEGVVYRVLENRKSTDE